MQCCDVVNCAARLDHPQQCCQLAPLYHPQGACQRAGYGTAAGAVISWASISHCIIVWFAQLPPPATVKPSDLSGLGVALFRLPDQCEGMKTSPLGSFFFSSVNVCSRECPGDVVAVLNFDPFHPASTDVAESRGFSQSDQRMPISLKPLHAAPVSRLGCRSHCA